MVLDQSGSRTRAQEFYEKALSKRLDAGDKQGAAESLASLAASYYDMGRVEESDTRYREAYGLAKDAFPPLHPTRGQISRSWCRVLSSISKFEESLKQCDEALQIESSHGDEDRFQALLTEINRGVTLGEMGRYPEAVESLKDALTGLRASYPSYRLEILEAVRSLGVVLVDSGQVSEGAALLSEALKEETTTLGEMHPDVLQTQGNYGVVLAMEGKLSESEAVLTDYARKSDAMRLLYGSEERIVRGVFSRYASTRMFLAKVLINQGRCREAFDWIEETKARSLRDQIQERAAFGEATEQDQELFASLNETRNRLYIERAQAAGDGAKESGVDSRLQSVDGQIQELVTKARARESALTGSVNASSAIQELIKGADTLAVAFGLVEQEVLVVTYGANSKFQCTSLGDWHGLYETLWATHALELNPTGMAGLLAGGYGVPPSRIVRSGRRTFRLISRADPIPEGFTIETSANKMLSDVGNDLLGWPVSKAGSARRMVVSPDGLVGIVALDALPVNGRPLITRFSVSQVVSFAHSARNEHAPLRPKKQYAVSMVAFGDPVYEDGEPPQSTAAAVQKARLVLRGNYNQSSTWPTLPASGIELRGLTALYHLQPGKTVFTREKATVRNLEALNASGTLMGARFLVFSAHAFADISDPELSSVVLTRSPGGGPRDSYLTAIQLSSLRVDSELVFFSACETGFGQVVTGEGVVSLSSAAITAGAHATVNTLWSIPDATSADFTKQFFNTLHRGRSPEEALTETKRTFMHDPRHASTAFWASYVLVQR
jgi:tetratricopeptide (TPR) repeat protein